MQYYIIVALRHDNHTNSMCIFLCYHCYSWCTFCQNTLSKHLLLCSKGSKSVVSTLSQHHNMSYALIGNWLIALLVIWNDARQTRPLLKQRGGHTQTDYGYEKCSITTKYLNVINNNFVWTGIHYLQNMDITLIGALSHRIITSF